MESDEDSYIKLSEALKKHDAIVYSSAIGESDKEIPDDYVSLAGVMDGDNLEDYEIGIAIPRKYLEDRELFNLLAKQAQRALFKGMYGV